MLLLYTREIHGSVYPNPQTKLFTRPNTPPPEKPLVSVSQSLQAIIPPKSLYPSSSMVSVSESPQEITNSTQYQSPFLCLRSFTQSYFPLIGYLRTLVRVHLYPLRKLSVKRKQVTSLHTYACAGVGVGWWGMVLSLFSKLFSHFNFFLNLNLSFHLANLCIAHWFYVLPVLCRCACVKLFL